MRTMRLPHQKTIHVATRAAELFYTHMYGHFFLELLAALTAPYPSDSRFLTGNKGDNLAFLLCIRNLHVTSSEASLRLLSRLQQAKHFCSMETQGVTHGLQKRNKAKLDKLVALPVIAIF